MSSDNCCTAPHWLRVLFGPSTTYEPVAVDSVSVNFQAALTTTSTENPTSSAATSVGFRESVTKCEPCLLLTLPDELIRLIGFALWNPVIPENTNPMSCTCRRLAAQMQIVLDGLDRLVLRAGHLGELARWGSAVIGPPWHMVPGSHGRSGLQSYMRFVVVRNSSPAEAVTAIFTRHWRLPTPRGLVRVAGGGRILDPALRQAVVAGLASLGRSRCWLISDGLGGQVGTVSELVGAARELIDNPGLRTVGAARRPVLLAFAPLDQLLCSVEEALLAGRRGAQLVLDQSEAPSAHRTQLERHHTHAVISEPSESERDDGSPLLRRTLHLALTPFAAAPPPPPCVFVLIHGGPGDLSELAWHLEQRWPAVCLAGSGGAADHLASLLEGTGSGGDDAQLVERAAECAAHKQLIVVARLCDGDIDLAVTHAMVRTGCSSSGG